jgi:hypothetical protein
MDHDPENDNNQPKIEIREVTMIHEEEDVSPPPDIQSKFKTIQEWLLTVCDNEKPKTKIATYEIGLFESPGEYILYLVGLNTYDKNPNHTITRIDFEPADMYFRLPETEYKNLNSGQVLNKIKIQLKDFIKTEKFKTSFLAQANSIKTTFDGDEIWSA